MSEWENRKEFRESMLNDFKVYCNASSFDEAKHYCNILKEKAKSCHVDMFIVPIPSTNPSDGDHDILITFYSYIHTLDSILYNKLQIGQAMDELFIMSAPLSSYKNAIPVRYNRELLGTFIFPDGDTFQNIKDDVLRKTMLRLRDLLLKDDIVLDVKTYPNLSIAECIPNRYYLMLFTDKDSTEAVNICLKYLKGGINDE